jgi:hypothetical protein
VSRFSYRWRRKRVALVARCGDAENCERTDVTRCSVVVILRRLKSVDSGDGGSLGRNRATYLPEYKASQNTKHLSSLSLLWESQILHLQTGSHGCLNLLCLTKFKYSFWQKLCVSHDTEFLYSFYELWSVCSLNCCLEWGNVFLWTYHRKAGFEGREGHKLRNELSSVCTYLKYIVSEWGCPVLLCLSWSYWSIALIVASVYCAKRSFHGFMLMNRRDGKINEFR